MKKNDSVVWGVDRAPAQQELDELTAQRDQLADILTRTANALKNEPAELTQHSWHDLPDVAQQLKAAQQEPVAIADGTFNHNCPIGTPLYTSPPAQRNPLTPDEITAICKQVAEGGPDDSIDRFVRAIEAAHGIKGDA